MIDIQNELSRMVEAMEPLSLTARRDFLIMAAMETGGTFKTPQRDNNWDNQLFEISAHGVYADGTDLADAIRNWMLVATRQATAQHQLARADMLVRQPPGTVDTPQLRDACKLLLTDARTASQRMIAEKVLSGLQVSA